MLLVLVRRIMTLRRLVNRLYRERAIADLAIRTLLRTVLDRRVIGYSILACRTHGIRRNRILRPIMIIGRLDLIELVTVRIRRLECLLLSDFLVVVRDLEIRRVALLTLTEEITGRAYDASRRRVELVTAALRIARRRSATGIASIREIYDEIYSRVNERRINIGMFLDA